MFLFVAGSRTRQPLRAPSNSNHSVFNNCAGFKAGEEAGLQTALLEVTALHRKLLLVKTKSNANIKEGKESW